ncbi:MAG: flagellar hook capping FlgD N-terminal domain-containing protein [Pseudomonadota bacterium]
MEEIFGVNPAAQPAQQSAFGLDFQSLLQIILSQLTFQDPLKPAENFEFVSQLAQFSQLQQSQVLNEQITNLLAAQSATQATGLLGQTVDVAAGGGVLLSGTVEAISFAGSGPSLTITTPDGQSIPNISIANVTQIR